MRYSTRTMTSGEIYAANQARETGQPYTEGVAVLAPSGLMYRAFPGTAFDRPGRWTHALRVALELNKGTARNPRVA